MSDVRDFLDSVKADLTDRRLLVVLALLGAALVAALAWAVLGGGSSVPAPAAVPSTPAVPATTGLSGISVSQARVNPDEAVAETTSGSADQHRGSLRNPFALLPGATTSTTGSATKGASSGGSGASGASSAKPSPESASQGSGGTPSGGSHESRPHPQPKTVYDVSVLFGIAPPAGTQSTPAAPTQTTPMSPGASTGTGTSTTPVATEPLTAYPKVKRNQPLPSASQALIVFRGVTTGGTRAIFTLVGEAILRGSGGCLPSTSQCQALALKPGQYEELEYLPPSGSPVDYRLEVVNITARQASAAAAGLAFGRESKRGRELLRRIGRTAVPGLDYSSIEGVLAPARRRALAGGVQAGP